jgi:uncharacterized radical SAM superfamily Fe-S cluster-containing enzyme
MSERKLIKKTRSLCPECLAVLPAEIFEEDKKVWIEKECGEHGKFKEIYWGDSDMYHRAQKYRLDGKGVHNPQIAKDNPSCPMDCGLCNQHKSHTALANMVITNRCDLHCWYCFFFAEKAGYIYEPTLDQIKEMAQRLRRQKPIPCNAVQLTGGEPTMRKDLLDIVRIFKEEDFDYVQLNTDGINMAKKGPEYCKELRSAGINNLYLSFDGVTPKTNPKNHWEAPAVLDNCRPARLGVVLVPTVIKSVNDHELGDIIRFGFKNADIVRGVNFQPVSLVGRMPQEERQKYRITIPDAVKNIEEQTDGQITKEDFYTVPVVVPISRFLEAINERAYYELSTHPSCGAATYIFQDGKKIIPITRFLDVDGFTEFLNEKAEEINKGKHKLLASADLLLKVGSFVDTTKQPSNLDFKKLLFEVMVKRNYRSLRKLHHNSLFIGMMHFMDLYNYDIDRVERCCIHYTSPDGRIVPFCAFNVLPELYRDKTQKRYGVSIEDWEKQTGKKLKDDYYIRKLSEQEKTE